MKLLPYLIDGLAVHVSSGDVWGKLQAFVPIVDAPTASGSGKRSKVLTMVEEASPSLAGFLLNLLLEPAVAKLRSGGSNGG